MRKEVICCNGISKTFYTARGDVKVVDNLNLKVKENEIVVLFGPGQCGKSTVINCLS